MKKALLGAVIGILGFWFFLLASAAGLTVTHTAFPNADASAEFGIPLAVENLYQVASNNIVTKTINTNYASSAYQVPSNTAYVLFAGTVSSPLAVSMPSASNALDSEEVMVWTQAAASATWAATGASVVGAPSTINAAQGVKFKYDVGTLTWYALDH